MQASASAHDEDEDANAKRGLRSLSDAALIRSYLLPRLLHSPFPALARFLAVAALAIGCSGSPAGDSEDPSSAVDVGDDAPDISPGDALSDGIVDALADAHDGADDAGDLQPDDEEDVSTDVLDPSDADAGSDDVLPDAQDAPDVQDVAPPCAEIGNAIEGDLLQVGADWSLAVAAPCSRFAVPIVIPAGTRMAFDARQLPAGSRLAVYPASWWVAQGEATGPLPLAVSERATDTGAQLTVEATGAIAGEHWLVLERDDQRSTDEVELRVTCRAGCESEATRYPIVLLHGYAGVDSYFGVLDYFFDVVNTLDESGFTAWTPVVDAIATSVDRAEQLAPQIDDVFQETGARRVNLIAHSQGGLDARWLISQMGYGDRVASLTTVATPHGGIPTLLFDFFSAQDFSDDAMAEFNAAAMDDPRVRYWSWAFRSCQILQFACVRDSDGETVDTFLIATHTLLLRFGENDGIVPTDRMVWGEFLGLRYADHFDQVGQIADGTSERDAFDHRAFYVGEARRLASESL